MARHPVRELVGYLRPYRLAAILAPLLMVLEVAMDLTLPFLMRRTVDLGIARGDLPLVIRTGLLMLGVTILGAFGGLGCTVFAVRAGINFGADLRSALYRKVQALSFGNLDKLGTGQLITRLTSDVNQVQELVLIALRILVRAPLLVVGSLLMAIVTSPRLAPLLLVLVPLLVLVLYFVIKRSYPLFFSVQERLDQLNSLLQENLAGVRLVKAFGRGPHEERRFAAANDAYMGSSIRAMQFSATVGPFMMLAINAGVAGALWLGGLYVVGGAVTVGEIIAFTNYLRQTLFSLMMVSMLLIQISRAGASASRIAEVLHAQPEVQDPAEPISPEEGWARGPIAFEDVSFSYGEGSPVLQDVRFLAEPGQVVAILGATGSGKSTLVNLIPRFYDVQKGRVAIGGADVRELRQAELRAHMGIVLQEPILFTGTIAENIRQGRPEATDEQVQAAARAAQAHEFIMSLPEGYNTVVGQRGVNLSGGQKQRIAIARALVRQPEILILDDAMSAVDVETEARLRISLRDFARGTTCVLVAQRISSVLQADKILVLEEGHIVAEGTHWQLLESSPAYRAIYESQLGNGPVAAQELADAGS